MECATECVWGRPTPVPNATPSSGVFEQMIREGRSITPLTCPQRERRGHREGQRPRPPPAPPLRGACQGFVDRRSLGGDARCWSRPSPCLSRRQCRSGLSGVGGGGGGERETERGVSGGEVSGSGMGKSTEGGGRALVSQRTVVSEELAEELPAGAAAAAAVLGGYSYGAELPVALAHCGWGGEERGWGRALRRARRRRRAGRLHNHVNLPAATNADRSAQMVRP